MAIRFRSSAIKQAALAGCILRSCSCCCCCCGAVAQVHVSAQKRCQMRAVTLLWASGNFCARARSGKLIRNVRAFLFASDAPLQPLDSANASARTHTHMLINKLGKFHGQPSGLRLSGPSKSPARIYICSFARFCSFAPSKRASEQLCYSRCTYIHATAASRLIIGIVFVNLIAAAAAATGLIRFDMCPHAQTHNESDRTSPWPNRAQCSSSSSRSSSGTRQAQLQLCSPLFLLLMTLAWPKGVIGPAGKNTRRYCWRCCCCRCRYRRSRSRVCASLQQSNQHACTQHSRGSLKSILRTRARPLIIITMKKAARSRNHNGDVALVCLKRRANKSNNRAPQQLLCCAVASATPENPSSRARS